MQNLILQGYDAIIVLAGSDTALNGVVKDACNAGIVVVAFASGDLPAHHILLGAGILIGENFARLGTLPPVCSLAALPLPIVDGSGSPLRALAFVPRPP